MSTFKRCGFKFGMLLAWAVALVGGSGCETVKKETDPSSDLKVPAFVHEARKIAEGVKPASEAPIEVNKVVPERAAGKDELTLPTREVRVPESTPRFDFPSELIKGMKKPEDKQPVELDFDATPLSDVVPLFAGLLEFNYMIDPAVKGTVTISVEAQMNAREIWAMFEHILWLSGAYVSRNNQFVEILPFEKMPEQRRLLVKHNPANVEVAFINLKSVNSSEVLANVKPFMTKGASITDIKRLNSLLIVEAPTNMPKLRELIDNLDQQWHRNWPQASIKCHSVDTETIIEELKTIMPIIGLPTTFDAAKTEGTEIKITGISRLQVIVVSAPTADALKEVSKWIKVLDREDIGEQEHIYFYNVRHSTIEDLRAALDTFFNTEGAVSTKKKSVSSKAGATKNSRTRTPSRTSSSKNDQGSDARSTAFDVPVTIFEDTARNRLSIRTTPRAYALVQALLSRLDTPPLQVLIQTTIVDLTLTEGLEYGFRYAVEGGEGSVGSSVQSDPSLDNLIDMGGLKQLSGSSGFNLFFSDSKSALNFIASVAGRKNTSVVSAPQIVAISDEEATLEVSRSESVVTDTRYENSERVNTYSYKDAGTVLKVTPHITANNEVTLNVKQDIDQFLKQTDLELELGKSPTIQKRKLETTLVVPDGQTVLLGGMIKDTNEDYVEGIPVLMDIPYLGELFKYTKKDKTRTQLLVLMTVNVIDQSTRLQDLIRNYPESLKSINKSLGPDAGTEHLSVIGELKKSIKETNERVLGKEKEDVDVEAVIDPVKVVD